MAGGSIIGVSFNETHIIGEYQLTAPPYTSTFLFVKMSSFAIPDNALNEHEVRIWNGNKNYTADESRFILIGPERVFEIKSFKNSEILGYNNPSDMTVNYVECIYETFDSKIFIHSPLQGGVNEFTLEYKGSTSFTKLLVRYPDSTVKYNKALFFGNKIIFLTTKNLIIIGTNQQVYSNITVNFINEFLDMNIFDDRLVIASQGFVNVYKLDDFQSNIMPSSVKNHFTPIYNFTGIKLFSLNQGYACANSTLLNISLNDNSIVPITTLSPNMPYKIDATPDRVPFIFVKNQLSQHYFFIPPQNVYTCQGTCQCLNGYIGSTVIKCVLLPLDDSSTEQQDRQPFYYCDGICSCESGYNQTLLTICQKQILDPQDPEDPQEPQEPEEPQDQSAVEEASAYKNFFDEINKDVLRMITQTIANVFTLCSLNITPKIFLSFLAFIQDIWLYQYHKSKSDYPTTAKFFLQEASFIGEIKICPTFLQANSFMKQSNVAVSKNEQMIEYIGLSSEKDIDKVYFSHSSEQIYKTNLLMNLLYFIFLKLLHLLFYILKNKFKTVKKFKNIYLCLKRDTAWWTLLISIFQANILILSFDSALQILLSSSFTWNDKFNLTFTFLVLFVLIIYSTCFFVLVFSMLPKGTSANLLCRCKYKENSFFFESSMFVIRQLMRSFVHGFLIMHYNYQIFILAMFDLIFIATIIKMRKYFISSIIFILVLVYNIGLFVFDIYFFVEFIQPKIMEIIDRQFFGLVCLSSLAALSLLETLYYALSPLVKLAKKAFQSSNKITSFRSNGRSEVGSSKKTTLIVSQTKSTFTISSKKVIGSSHKLTKVNFFTAPKPNSKLKILKNSKAEETLEDEVLQQINLKSRKKNLTIKKNQNFPIQRIHSRYATQKK